MPSPNNPAKYVPTDRELPKPVRFTSRGFIYRQFTLWERFKIAFGFRLMVECHIASEHNPGLAQPMMKFHLTAEKSQAKALLDLRKQVEADVESKRYQRALEEAAAKKDSKK